VTTTHILHSHIRYTADFDASTVKATKCNCTYDQKRNFVILRLENFESDFKLLSPDSKDKVATYAPETEATKNGIGEIQRYFCSTCGVHVWVQGWYKANGQTFDPASLNLATIDQPQEGIDLSQVKIQYVDLLHNNPLGAPQSEPYPGGLI